MEESRPRGSFSTSATGHRTRFIHNQGPAHQFLAVAGLACAHRRRVVVDFDKAESTSLPSETVAHDGHGIDSHTVFGEERVHILFAGCIWKISNEELFHSNAP
jgi:hypothetical protein